MFWECTATSSIMMPKADREWWAVCFWLTGTRERPPRDGRVTSHLIVLLYSLSFRTKPTVHSSRAIQGTDMRDNIKGWKHASRESIACAHVLCSETRCQMSPWRHSERHKRSFIKLSCEFVLLKHIFSLPLKTNCKWFHIEEDISLKQNNPPHYNTKGFVLQVAGHI